MVIPLLLILYVYYPDEIKTHFMLCSGHVARAHVNKMARIKTFTKQYKNKYRVKFLVFCRW